MDLNKVKELRNKTNASLSMVKKFLEMHNGDMDKAEESIRQEWTPTDRITGCRMIYVHTHQNRIGVMLELSCCTDFVAKTAEFKELAHELALQLVAGLKGPLEEQEWVRDSSKKVGDLIKEVAGKTGETIKVTRHMRWSV